MGRIPNTQQSRQMPALKPIDLDGQDLNLSPIAQFIDSLAQPRSDLNNVGTERIDAARLEAFIRTFRDDETRLKIILAIDQDQRLSVVDVAEHLRRVAWPAAQPKPQDIDRHAMLDYFKSGRAARRRMAAIATHYEIRTHMHLSPIVPGHYSGDAPAASSQIHHFMLHEQVKRGEHLCMTGNKVQEIPLWHERDKFAVHWHMAKVGHFECGISDNQSHRLHLLMGQLEELLEQPEFFQYFESGWMDCVAAKIAEKVLVLFEHRYLDTLARQQVPEHHARRTAADDTATSFHNLICHRVLPPLPVDVLRC